MIVQVQQNTHTVLPIVLASSVYVSVIIADHVYII